MHTGGNSVAFSLPEESMWPVNQVVLSRKLPHYETTSHERTKHMFSRLGNVTGHIDLNCSWQRGCALEIESP